MTPTVTERIGIDIGHAETAPERAAAAARAGARIVRLRFALSGSSGVDDAVLARARAATKAARDARIRVLAVLDHDLTVAPGGAAGLGVSPAVAEAWGRELAGNAERLAAALGDQVAAWEVLPGPNWRGPSGSVPRLPAARWAALLAEVATALRDGHPEAQVVAGALISDDEDDGVAYLREAASAGGWRSHAGAPVDALAVQLAVLPEGGPSEGVVAATVAERTQRLWRAAESCIAGARRPKGLWVTGVSWDAIYAGEAAQARNLWTALDTLSADPSIAAVIWTALVDQNASNGLFASSGSLDAASRRPAWTAFHDFATYARQISPPIGAATLVLGADGTTDGDEALTDLPLTGEIVDAALPGISEARSTSDFAPLGEDDPTSAANDRHAQAADAQQAATDALPVGHRAHEDNEASATESSVLPTADEAYVEPPTEPIATPVAQAARTVHEPDGALDDARASGDGRTGGSQSESAIDGSAMDESANAGGTDALSDADAGVGRDFAADGRADQAGPGAGDGDGAGDGPFVSGASSKNPTPPEDHGVSAGAVRFRMPTIAEVLSATGLSGARHAAALAEIDRRYGSREWLPPGAYDIDLPLVQDADIDDPERGASPALASRPTPTNQTVLSALYQVGGGSWALLERVGLDLATLVTGRDAPYEGPDLTRAEGLTSEQRAALARALAGPAPE